MTPDYDLAIAGGGLAGAALAKSMAAHGARVLVIEKETQFKDRVRGEALMPWGHAEARALGIDGDLARAHANPLHWFDVYAATNLMAHREVVPTTPQQLPCLAFGHPAMQESLLEAAAVAGATVRRGASVTSVEPGAPAKLTVQEGGQTETVSARLVVGAEGRSSAVRTSAHFPVQRDPENLHIAGVLFENSSARPDTGELIYHFPTGQFVGFFPQTEGHVRVYFCCHAGTHARFQGAADVPRFLQACLETGMNPAHVEGARPIGPLATFDAAHSWVDHPYREGIALVGDTATSSDPTWGQGLSLTMRDVRVLRDHLLATSDWDAAGNAYAADHDTYSSRLHAMNNWFTEFYMATGPTADARRDRAFPLIGQDPTRQPDHLFIGPDFPADDSLRKRFYAED